MNCDWSLEFWVMILKDSSLLIYLFLLVWLIFPVQVLILLILSSLVSVWFIIKFSYWLHFCIFCSLKLFELLIWLLLTVLFKDLMKLHSSFTLTYFRWKNVYLIYAWRVEHECLVWQKHLLKVVFNALELFL